MRSQETRAGPACHSPTTRRGSESRSAEPEKKSKLRTYRGRVVQINAVIRGRDYSARGGGGGVEGERQAVINACVARHNSAAQ